MRTGTPFVRRPARRLVHRLARIAAVLSVLLVGLAVAPQPAQAATATLSGVITASGGGPLAGVSVTLYETDGSGWWWDQATTTTDSAGAYSFSQMRADTFTIGASDPNGTYGYTFLGDTLSVQTATSFAVAEGAVITGKNLAMGAAGHVTGKVTGTGGAAVGGIKVTAWWFNPALSMWQKRGTTTSDAAGNYNLGGLRTTTYRIGFEDTSGTYVTEYYNNAAAVEAAQDLSVSVGGAIPNISAQLVAGSKISGTVTNASGTGLANIVVWLYRPTAGGGWHAFEFAESSSSGVYTFNALPAGDYRLEFRDLHNNNYVTRFYPAATTVEAGSTVVVAQGVSRSGVNVQLPLASHITGTVTGPDGAPLTAVAVYASSLDPVDSIWRTRATGYSDASGHYDVGQLPEGTYRLRFDLAGYVTEFWNNQTSIEAAQDVVTTQATPATGKDAQLAYGPYVALGPPVISGTVKVGSTLSAYPGFWSPQDAAYAYQWSAAGKAISGATNSTYVPVVADIGKRLRVTVTASGTKHQSASAVSAETAAVPALPTPSPTSSPTPSAAPSPTSAPPTSQPTTDPLPTVQPPLPEGPEATVVIVNTVRPKIKGKAKVGKVLKAWIGAWTPVAGTTFTYQWYAGKKAIKNATQPKLRIAPKLRGKKISVGVTASAQGARPVVVRSKPTARIKA